MASGENCTSSEKGAFILLSSNRTFSRSIHQEKIVETEMVAFALHSSSQAVGQSTTDLKFNGSNPNANGTMRIEIEKAFIHFAQ
jgi:hypothetical protein